MKIGAYLILIFSVFALALSGYQLLMVYTHPVKYKEEIIEQAGSFDLPAELVASMINVESSFNPNAKSNKDAIGLMQVKLSTAEYLIDYYNLNETISETDLFTPNINIRFGCMYFKYLLNKFQNINTALASYNAGETRVRVWLSDKNYSLDNETLYNIPYDETKNYVTKVNKNVRFYQKIY